MTRGRLGSNNDSGIVKGVDVTTKPIIIRGSVSRMFKSQLRLRRLRRSRKGVVVR